jgi:Helix-turn-helix of DDE superfamily endonuclease
MPMSYAEVSRKELKFLDLTSLTVEEFQQLLPVFEKDFRERMKHFCLDGKPRVGRGYRTYSNCPLPTPEDRLLFILVYLKNNPLQVMQGELFGMPQNKANQWIHSLLPVLLTTMRSLGDAPARSLEELAQQLSHHVVLDSSSSSSDAPHTLPAVSASSSEACEASLEQAKPEGTSSPLFAMMEQKDVSSVPKTKMNRKATIAARKNATQ